MTKKDEVKGALLDMEMCVTTLHLVSILVTTICTQYTFFCISQALVYLTKNKIKKELPWEDLLSSEAEFFLIKVFLIQLLVENYIQSRGEEEDTAPQEI